MTAMTSKDSEHHAALLYEASRLLGAPLHLQPGIDAFLTNLLHRHGLSVCMLLTDQGDGTLAPVYFAGVSSAFASGLSVRSGQGIAGVVSASGTARRLDPLNGGEEDSFLKDLVTRHQLRSAFLVPLKAEGRVLGTALFGARTTSHFSESLIASLTELSQYLGLALHNSRRVQSLESSLHTFEAQVAAISGELGQTNQRLVHKVRELKTVYDLALATAASTQVEDIVRVIITGIQELVEVQSGAFFLLQGSDTLEPIPPAFGRQAGEAEALACRVSQSKWLEHVVREQEPQILNFVDSEEILPPSWKSAGVRSVLALPLLQEGVTKGVFCVINKMNGLFSPDDVRILSLLTGRVADVLHRLALDQQLRQRVNDLSVLQEISTQLPSPPVLTDTVSSIGRVTRQALGNADVCLFFIHHVESEALAMIGGDWDPKLSFDARALTLGVSERVPLAETFRQNQPAQFEKDSSAAFWNEDALVGGLSLHQLLYLPLTVEQGRIGVLAIGARPPRFLTLDHRRLAGLIAKHVAIVIERSRLYERLKSANDKLEQINHLKNEFISMVSHELRTPLTTIKGFVSIVLNEETGPLNDQQRHFLETSDRAIDRLTLLVSDLLDISRIEAGQIKMQLRPIAIRDVCQRLSHSFDPQLKAQGLTLTLDIPEHLPAVLADPDRLGQVLDNFMTNSMKFTTQGGITISAVDKGDFVMISVKDTGQGIPKEEQERIFEKFYQIKVGSGYPSKGTGLGLAIVRSIIESHRGKVWVESEVGKGADFRFLIPRARTEPAAPPKT